MRKTIVASFLALLAASPGSAQTVSACDWRNALSALAEPWEANIKGFADGAIRLAVIDAIEPAAGPIHLLVLSPPFDELGARTCHLVSLSGAVGFAELSLDLSEASYDPSRGLTVRVPMVQWQPGDIYTNQQLFVTINQASGTIIAWVE